MRKLSRRKVMLLGGSLLGASIVGQSAANRFDEEQNSQPRPALDVHDITIKNISADAYSASQRQNWNVEVSIMVSNDDRRKYSVQIPVQITDKNGNRIDEIKKFDFVIPKSGSFEARKVWRRLLPDKAVERARNVSVGKVTVKPPGLLDGSHKDVTNNPEELIQDKK